MNYYLVSINFHRDGTITSLPDSSDSLFEAEDRYKNLCNMASFAPDLMNTVIMFPEEGEHIQSKCIKHEDGFSTKRYFVIDMQHLQDDRKCESTVSFEDEANANEEYERACEKASQTTDLIDAVIMYTEEGNYIKSKCFKHAAPTE